MSLSLKQIYSSLFFLIVTTILLTFSLKFSKKSKVYQDKRRLPRAIIRMLASRSMRSHHYLFHQIRNQWNLLDETSRQQITQLGWEPPRPARDSQGRYITNNDSGEDFLYMHREMIKEVNNILARGNYAYGKRVIGWPRIPPPSDIDYPVPPAYFLDNIQTSNVIANIKSNNYYYTTLRRLEARYKNPSVLRNMTLGQLGAFLEFQVHNPMHTRWSSPVINYRRDPYPFWQTDYIDTLWDDPSYDWLGDFYASHVNVVFWKLHGWVDDRINDWQNANNLSTIKWKGTWLGPPGHTHSNSNSEFVQISFDNQGKINDKVIKILHKSLSQRGVTNSNFLTQKNLIIK